MTLFSYKARNLEGKLTKGQVEAEVLSQAVSRLQQSGLFIIDIKPLTKAKKDYNSFFKNKVRIKDLALFCRQLSFMLEAGVPLVFALQVITQNQSSSSIENLSKGLIKELHSGHSFGKACANFPREIPPLMRDLVIAGETGGFLDNALARLADYFTKEVEIKEKVKTAMIYPMLVVFIALIAISVIFTFVVPVFSGILEDMNAPLPVGTKIVLAISLLFRKYWYLLLGGLLVLSFGFIFYWKTPHGKKKIDEISFKIPIFKHLNQKVVIARFCRTLGNLLHSGVPLVQALEIVEITIGNMALKKELEEALKKIKDGKSLTESFRRSEIFPSLVIQMLAVGEQSGNLDNLLVKVGDYYDSEVSEASERLPKLIEPIMLVFLGIIVGLIVLGVLMPMFSVMGGIGM